MVRRVPDPEFWDELGNGLPRETGLSDRQIYELVEYRTAPEAEQVKGLNCSDRRGNEVKRGNAKV